MKKLFFLLSIVLFSAYNSQAQSYQTHALYIYSFAKYVEWPASAPQGDFVIGVVGESGIKAPLEKMASLKKVKNRVIKVVTFNSPDEIADCHILFLPKKQSKDFVSVGTKILGKPILLITEKEGLGEQGSSINFIEKNKKPVFEINNAAINNANLKVASELLRFAIQL